MKYYTLFILFLFSILFYQCNTSKIIFQEKPEFDILEVFSQGFVGGQPGNAGINVVINVENSEDIIPDSLYFQQRVAALEVKPYEKGVLWVARFQHITRSEPNLNENPNGDLTAEVPIMENFPFDLQNNEAVLLYHKNNTALYYKIINIKQKETIFFPAAKPQNRVME